LHFTMRPIPTIDLLDDLVQRVHRAITAHLTAPGAPQLSKVLDWQVLDMVQRLEPTDMPKLFAALRPVADPDKIIPIVSSFLDIGWLVFTPMGPTRIEHVQLTPVGTDQLAAAYAWRQDFLTTALALVSPEDYNILTTVLTRVLDNLGGRRTRLLPEQPDNYHPGTPASGGH
jgi:hypothetical protein